MLNRLLTAFVSLGTLTAVLHGSVAPAAACTCAVVESDQQLADMVGFFDAVVEGAVAGEKDGLATFAVEKSYKGELAGEIVLNQPAAEPESLGADCGYTVGEPGTRYVLFLMEDAAGFVPGGCASFSLDGPPSFGYTAALYERLQRLYGDGGGSAPGQDAGGMEPGDGAEQSPPQSGDEDVSPGEIAEAVPISAPAGEDGVLELQDEAAEGAEKDVPWPAITALALLVPLGFLAVATLTRGKGTGH